MQNATEGAQTGKPADAGLAKGGDTYLERVAKYVPAEIVAFYIFANLILRQANVPHATMAGMSVVTIGMAVFVGAWIFVPLYLVRLADRESEAWVINAVVATLLFPIWAYAVEGVGPTHLVSFDGNFASIVLGAASLASGIVKPRDRVAGSPPPDGDGPEPGQHPGSGAEAPARPLASPRE